MSSEIQRIIIDYLEELGVSQRQFAELTGVSDATYGGYRRMETSIKLDLVDKIVSNYPDLRIRLAGYLTGNNGGNITPKDKTMNNDENPHSAKETFYRDLIENNTEYSLLPKAILKDYKIVPDKLLDIITESKDQVNNELKKKQELLIEIYEGRIKKLEEEKEDLRRQIPPKK